MTHSNLISQHSPHFSNLEIDLSGDLKCISTQLKVLTVGEWKCNQYDYEEFLPEINIQQEAMNFCRVDTFMVT